MTTLPLTLTDAAVALRDGSITSVSLTETMLACADKLDDTLGTYLARCDEAALEAARRADAELASGTDRGPLHGIPLAVKDIVSTEGMPTTAAEPRARPGVGRAGRCTGGGPPAGGGGGHHRQDVDDGVRHRPPRPGEAVPRSPQSVEHRPVVGRLQLRRGQRCRHGHVLWLHLQRHRWQHPHASGHVRRDRHQAHVRRVPKNGVVPLSCELRPRRPDLPHRPRLRRDAASAGGTRPGAIPAASTCRCPTTRPASTGSPVGCASGCYASTTSTRRSSIPSPCSASRPPWPTSSGPERRSSRSRSPTSTCCSRPAPCSSCRRRWRTTDRPCRRGGTTTAPTHG